MSLTEAEFVAHISQEVEVTPAEAGLVLRSGVTSLVALMSLVGRGDHTSQNWPGSLVFKAERWYWALRKSGILSKQMSATAVTGQGKRRHPRTSPKNSLIARGVKDTYQVSSHDYGKAGAAAHVSPACDEGRTFLVIDPEQPSELGWEPPHGWAEVVKPHPVDPQLHHPPPEQQFTRPAHHGTIATNPDDRYHFRPARSYRTSKSRSRHRSKSPENNGMEWVSKGKSSRQGSRGGGRRVQIDDVNTEQHKEVSPQRGLSPGRVGEGGGIMGARSPAGLRSFSPDIRRGYSGGFAEDGSGIMGGTPPTVYKPYPSLSSEGRRFQPTFVT